MGVRIFSLLVLVLLHTPVVAQARQNDVPRQVDAEELRTLKAGSGEIVTVTATVCYQDPFWKFLFLIDQGSGVFVDTVPETYSVGDRLRITGPIGNGHGVPIFRDDVVIQKVGTADLPEPTPADLCDWDWDTGFADKRNTGWVELEGLVEQVVLIDNSTRLWCRGKYRLFPVTIAKEMKLESAWDLVGSKVRILGSLGILLNRQNRIQGPLLLTQSRDFLKVVEPASAASFPANAPQRVSYAKVDESGAFRTTGEVTLGTDESLFIDDGLTPKAIRVVSSFETPVDSFVEVLGTVNDDGAWQARVIAIRHQSLEISPTELSVWKLTEDQIGRRIRIRGDVVGYRGDGASLRISQAGRQAIVVLPQQEGKTAVDIRRPGLRAASLDLETAGSVDVIGVLERFESGTPIVHVASRDDVEVLDRRWALTPANFIRILAVLAVLLIGIGLIVPLLRRQVAVRTQALSALTAQLRASYESVDAGVVAVGSDGRLLTINGTANALLGASLSPGDPASEFVRSWEQRAEDPAIVYEMASAFRSDHEEPSVCEISLVDGGGKIRLTLAAINHEGRHIGNLWVMHDETRLQKLQAELFQAQKMDAIGTLAGGIAHDFNNLLTVIIGNLNILRMAKLEEQDRRTFIDEAEAASISAGEVVQQLVGLSRKTDLKRKVTDPNTIVTNLRPLLKHGFGSNIEFSLSTASDLPAVYVDPTQIEQVLLSLCVNARDAMPDGGTITLATESATLDDENAVILRVTDTGEGIPEGVQDKIFEPFFTTKDVGKGTGLGLATSFSVLSRHNGDLRCESIPGKGSTFSIVLPVAPSEEVMREELLPQIDSLKGAETILIVDDEWVVRTVASNLLKSGGYRSIEAKDGASGLETLVDLRSEIDLVLLDVTMPGMSGHEVLREIRRLYPDLPVLMCSGYDLTGNTERAFDHFVPKPFSAVSLFNAIRRVLDPTLRVAS